MALELVKYVVPVSILLLVYLIVGLHRFQILLIFQIPSTAVKCIHKYKYRYMEALCSVQSQFNLLVDYLKVSSIGTWKFILIVDIMHKQQNWYLYNIHG